jgi:hypothetical protein
MRNRLNGHTAGSWAFALLTELTFLALIGGLGRHLLQASYTLSLQAEQLKVKLATFLMRPERRLEHVYFAEVKQIVTVYVFF